MGHPALGVALLLALWACPGFAEEGATGVVTGTVRVQAPGGEPQPLQGPVVVYLTGYRQPPPTEAPVITQRDKTFLPDLRVIVAGQSIRFANEDVVVHNVFSTSRARPFDLGKPGPGQTRTVRFPEPGLVRVYCNIHETMWTNVLVLPNQAFTLVADDGSFVLRDVPPGTHSIHAWGPQVAPTRGQVVVTSGGTAEVTLSVEAQSLDTAHLDKFGRPYRERPTGYEP